MSFVKLVTFSKNKYAKLEIHFVVTKLIQKTTHVIFSMNFSVIISKNKNEFMYGLG